MPTSGIPDPYSTTILNASHIPQGLRLGKSVDVEPGSQPDVSAGTATTGDNNAVSPGFNDEEGVVRFPNFKWSVVGGGRLRVTVNGSDEILGAYLNGWIDWGNDGDFVQPGDQIINDRNIFDGNNEQIDFAIPLGTNINQSLYARFRICPSARPMQFLHRSERSQWGSGRLLMVLRSYRRHPQFTASTAGGHLTHAATGSGRWRSRHLARRCALHPQEPQAVRLASPAIEC